MTLHKVVPLLFIARCISSQTTGGKGQYSGPDQTNLHNITQNISVADIDGGWSEWGDWGPCSVALSCERGGVSVNLICIQTCTTLTLVAANLGFVI